MGQKLPLKLLLVLATNHEGLTYKELEQKTGFHINTVSRYVSYLDTKSLLEIKQKKSNAMRGKKWINTVRLKQEFKEDALIKFFAKVSKQLNCQLNDLFSN